VLVIHRAERADALAQGLAERLRPPGDDPFAPRTVAVPSKGVERWLAQQLSHVLGAVDGDGVCANVVFPSYTQLLDDAVAAVDAAYAEAVQRWAPERAVWPLMQVVDRCAPTEDWCRVLATYLGVNGPGDKGRRFAVAGKLARLFDRYGRSRPELLEQWRDGHDDLPDDLTWQAELWRRLRAEIGTPAPAELLDAACAKVAPGPGFSIFGPTRISPARVKILTALAARRDVDLWLHHPSPALWAAVQRSGERPGRRRDQAPVVQHPLLASMSRDVRELQQLLETVPHEDVHHPLPPRADTLLGRLQDALAADRVPTGPRPIAATDDSLQIHAAHGPARQVEVVREVILGLLAADPTLEPRDIVIMCPDVETFAPLVAATFGMADEPDGHPAAKLRVRLADRSLRQTNPLLRLLSQVLELAAGRVTATQLLDVAGARPVRRLFGFDDDDIERLRDWSVTAGARWGLDRQHRGAYKLGGLAQGTWRAATDRLLLGVAMEDDGAWVGETLPLDDVDSGDIDLAGRFAELVDRLDEAVGELNRRRPVGEWSGVLEETVRRLGEGDQPWQLIQLRRELGEVADDAGDTDVELGLADVTALLHARLAGRPTRASFRTGTLTVCTLVPMRSVPHRVLCLVGMDDGAFPRSAVPDGDDVLARAPRTGERDPRSEDRQLFLDAICAAQEHLVITYTGADPRTGAEVPPCVPLGELLDAVDATALAPDGRTNARDHVVTRHPLQPFDRRNFTAGELGRAVPFSFDPAGLAGARAASNPRHPVPALVSQPLPATDAAEVELEELIRFLQHPARGFLRQRLGISTFEDDPDPADALPVSLDGLEKWAIGDRVLRRCLTGMPRATAARLEHLRGELPPGPLGNAVMRDIGRTVDAVLQVTELERAVPAGSVDVAVTLPDGRRVVGTIGGARGAVILDVTYSTLAAKHRLAAWVKLLAVVAHTGASDWRAVAVGKARDGVERCLLGGVEPVPAAELLASLVALRDAGLRAPLPMAVATSSAYAQARRRRMTESTALSVAERTWQADRFAPENREREHVLVFGEAAPFATLAEARPEPGEEYPSETTRFGALARRLWDPLVESQIAVRP
jgi:exodeoxyribonuclease V gamma subunit